MKQSMHLNTLIHFILQADTTETHAVQSSVESPEAISKVKNLTYQVNPNKNNNQNI